MVLDQPLHACVWVPGVSTIKGICFGAVDAATKGFTFIQNFLGRSDEIDVTRLELSDYTAFVMSLF